jgi:hypothetical protein
MLSIMEIKDAMTGTAGSWEEFRVEGGFVGRGVLRDWWTRGDGVVRDCGWWVEIIAFVVCCRQNRGFGNL